VLTPITLIGAGYLRFCREFGPGQTALAFQIGFRGVTAFARGFVVPQETERKSKRGKDSYKYARIDPPPLDAAGIWFGRDVEAFILLVSISCLWGASRRVSAPIQNSK